MARKTKNSGRIIRFILYSARTWLQKSRFGLVLYTYHYICLTTAQLQFSRRILKSSSLPHTHTAQDTAVCSGTCSRTRNAFSSSVYFSPLLDYTTHNAPRAPAIGLDAVSKIPQTNWEVRYSQINPQSDEFSLRIGSWPTRTRSGHHHVIRAGHVDGGLMRRGVEV